MPVPRRSNGEGSIYQRSDDRWVGSIRVRGLRKVVYGKARKEVADKLAQIRHDARVGKIVQPTQLATAEYLDSWLAARTDLRPGTRHLYASLIHRHIIPTIGHVKLKDILPIHIQEVHRRVGDHKRTAEQVYKLLHKALGDAVKLRALPDNPASLIDVPAARPAKRKLWSMDEIQAFVVVCSKLRYPYDALWLLMLATGCRGSEILGLRQEDVDWEASTITISRAIPFVNNRPSEEDPKSAAGIRKISMPGFGMRALKSRVPYVHGGYFFRTKTGSVPTPSDRRRRFIEACRRAGVPEGTPHDLRRIHATLAIVNGIDVKTVQQRLGHASLAMTLGIYTQAMEMGDIKAAQVFDAVFKESS